MFMMMIIKSKELSAVQRQTNTIKSYLQCNDKQAKLKWWLIFKVRLCANYRESFSERDCVRSFLII